MVNRSQQTPKGRSNDAPSHTANSVSADAQEAQGKPTAESAQSHTVSPTLSVTIPGSINTWSDLAGHF